MKLDKIKRVCSPIPQRYLLSLMGFFAVANAYTMRVCLNVAITVMVKKRDFTDNSTSGPFEDPYACVEDAPSPHGFAHEGEFEWSEATQGLILSSFFWGYVITHLPGGYLSERFGGKYTLCLGILSTAIFTILTPAVTRAGGSTGLIVLRVLEGLGEGSTFPAMSALLANWAPPLEKARLGSFAFAGGLMGTVIGQAMSGLILAHYDWPAVFYVFGGLALLWFVVFTLVCYSNPHSHPFISDKEAKYLDDNLQGIDWASKPAAPWKAISRSVPVWGLIAAQIGHDWVFYTMVTDLPKYLSNVMKMNIKANGFLSALPYLLMWVVSITSGYLCDVIIKRKWMSVTVARKVFTCLAAAGPAAGVLGASFSGCDRTAVMILFTLGMGVMGTYYPGIKVNGLDLSPNFAGTLMGVVNGIGAFAGIITPYLVGALTPDSTLLQWRQVFYISVGVAATSKIIYVLNGSGKIQPWNEISGAEKPVPGAEKDEDVGKVN